MSSETQCRGRRDSFDFVEAALRGHGKNRGSAKTAAGMWHCPGHEDNNPSLSVKRGHGFAKLKCYAGCDLETIVGNLGISISDLSDVTDKIEMRGLTPPKCVSMYPYYARDREVLSTKSRWEPGKNGGPKSFTWDKGNPHVLYNLPEVTDAEHVHVNEGEKAAEEPAGSGVFGRHAGEEVYDGRCRG
jgi:hypothetical protein